MTAVKRVFLAVCFAVLSYGSGSLAYTVAGDKEYKVATTPYYRFILQQSESQHLPQVIEFNRWLNLKYETLYGWTFDERANLVLLSDRNQVANGFATVIPNLLTVFYPSGFLLQDEFASSSWFETLLVHETAHLYQLNVKPLAPKALKKVVGNPFFVPLVVPIFIHPNTLLPLFLLEGNAVLQESSFQIGGRLQSGEAKAIAYAQILSEDLKSERLLNEHIDFPFTGKEKYILGGFFFQYLAETYGVDRVHLLFGQLAKSFIVPLFINDAFMATFQRGYNELFYDFVSHFKLRATGMKRSKAADLLTASFFNPLNQDDRSIFFHYQPDGRSMPFVVEVDRSTLKMKQTPQALLGGKVFRVDQDWATVASFQHRPTRIEYGLYDEAALLVEGSESQIVLDERQGQRVWAHPGQSFFRGQLYLNNQYFGATDSTAILSENGDVYQFLQDTSERVLLKNKSEIARFQGFYAKPLEVTKDGAFYFIASTEKGSSLYRFFNDRIQRAHPSDAIVDARHLKDDLFLIVEISHRAYHYKIDRLEPEEGVPFFDEKGVLSAAELLPRPPSSRLSQASTLIQQSPNNTPTLLNPKKTQQFEQTSQAADTNSQNGLSLQSDSTEIALDDYYYLASLLYSSAEISLSTAEGEGLLGSVDLLFNDPLQWNQLRLGYDRSTLDRNSYLASYINTRNRLAWGLSFFQTDNLIRVVNGQVLSRGQETVASGLLSLPLFVHGRWSSLLTTRAFWERDSLEFQPLNLRPQEALAADASLGLRYSLAFPLSFRAYREFAANLTYLVEDSEQRWTKTDEIFRAGWLLGGDLGSEFFARFSYDFARSRRNSIRLNSWERPFKIREDFFSIALGQDIRVDGLQTAEFELLKVLNHSFYFTRLPLSLRRWAPKVKARYFDIFRSYRGLQTQFLEYSLGSDFELVLAHRFAVQVGFDLFYFDDLKQAARPAGWRINLKSHF